MYDFESVFKYVLTQKEVSIAQLQSKFGLDDDEVNNALEWLVKNRVLQPQKDGVYKCAVTYEGDPDKVFDDIIRDMLDDLDGCLDHAMASMGVDQLSTNAMKIVKKIVSGNVDLNRDVFLARLNQLKGGTCIEVIIDACEEVRDIIGSFNDNEYKIFLNIITERSDS